MVGSGALFYAVNPRRAVLADVNPELMNFYRVLQRRPSSLYARLSSLAATEVQYYRMREAPATRSLLQRAVRFFYLTRLSWNGLYRVNRKGQFNVPYSGRSPLKLVSRQTLENTSRALRGVRLLTGDFATTTSNIRIDDFVYFDPPYPRGAHANNGFSRYSRKGFDGDQHKRLAQYASQLADSGVHVLVTEAARKEYLRLYSSSFHVALVRAPSLIAAGSAHRRDAYEAIITSYRLSR